MIGLLSGVSSIHWWDGGGFWSGVEALAPSPPSCLEFHLEWCHLADMIEPNSGQTLGLLGDPVGQIQMLVVVF